ncbi:NADH dehydrogenase subunit H [Jatrophihabitans sp. GAS493]|uniref:NADH-quinone oxidoreductase subunit NuoH n=1 Tax=Jatrophihabitans sp. GAS493 TaxID=1907575 RepID=UPI000BB757D3|nr:NADH-quinone oxidoreductase subunit NuoH [Jatrophihabitans sp. GAS493]SOD72322.1 NADH dehydrogenase subunit H [Jatrophihabitans sp. GAS493]
MSLPIADAVTPISVDVPGFTSEPVWLVIIKVLMVFAFLVVMTLFSIVFERKVVGRMQNRIGPNRVGPWGILQSLADGVKLAFKEEIIPILADKPVYFIAPILSAVPAFVAFCVIPFGPTVSMFGHETQLQLTDLPVGVLVVFACSSLGVYGIVLSGWASGSTYPLLGGLRSAAQMISYEVGMGLSLVAVFVISGSMSTSEIVAQQSHVWNVIPLFVSFAIYAVCVVGETNRAPFDLAEAESELVGGFHTEYSSFKFAMFFLAEYINMVTVSALATTLFLGGWHAPWGVHYFWSGCNSGWFPVIWFVLKVVACIFVFVWLRGTLPRMRYDQFMHLGWKVLIPINLIWIMAFTSFHVLTQRGWNRFEASGVVFIPVVAVILIVLYSREMSAARAAAEREYEDDYEASLPPPFPTPPMDLVVPPIRRSVRTATTPAGAVTAGSGAAGVPARNGDPSNG